MTYNRSSWHCKLWFWMHDGSIYSPNGASVCTYWWTVLVGVPFVCIMMTLLYPLVWFAEKIDKWQATRPHNFCPFGKVNFK